MTSVDERTHAAWTASLRRSPVLAHLPDDQLGALIDAAARRELADGDVLAGGESPAREAYLVVEGTCEATRGDESVRMHAPVLVGEIAVLTGTPTLATVRAIGEATAVALTREHLLDAIRGSAAAGQELTNVVAEWLCAPGSIGRVGRFPVEGIMGEGGSGRVLRARHPLLGIPLALKMLSHALALSEDGQRAFIREASLMVHLDHPGIVRVLDAFEAHGTFFIVMPWLEGATLREHIDRHSSLRPEQVVQIAEETLDALVVLHAAGLVHRDVKPSNLMLRPSGRVVLIDLGIACQRDASGSGRVVGSPTYCSPEQILGRPVDGRSDVYSLGCTLYELVFGRPPFEGEGIDAVLQAHLHTAPSFDRALTVPMSEPFLRWLGRCLSRTRARRPDAAQARAELGALVPPAPLERVAPRARVTVPMPVFLEEEEAGARG